MQKNIFEGNGLRATFVSLIYDHLMKRKFVSYATILAEYQGKDIDYYKGIKISLITNGLLLNSLEDHIIKKITWIRVSIQSAYSWKK